MKIRFIKFSVLAILLLASSACQKDNISEQGIQIQQSTNVRIVEYTINGEIFHTEIRGEKAWHHFLEEMAALAEQGYRVTFRDENRCTEGLTKDVHTYTTTDKQAAIRWCNDMVDQGYYVTMDYDKETGVYICTAVN